MPEVLVCSQGHEWTAPDEGFSATPDRPPLCPVCGSASEGFSTGELAGGATDLPPPPRPVPAVVAQVRSELRRPEGPRPDMDPLPSVAGYEVLTRLGRGGMGVVYQARHLRLKRLVALKMIRSGAHADSAERERFRREAEAVARLQHPHIVQIYEVGEQDGCAYLALEYVDGGSLAQALAGTPQPARDMAALLETLARAVQFAHEQGIIHRDLKPANVLLAACDLATGPLAVARPQAADWVPKITDFGLARQVADPTGPSPADDPTQTGDILGTPSYMAPEQTGGRSHPVGRAADIYALGAILYEGLTGRPPFRAESRLATVLQVRSDEPLPPRRLNSQVPRDLETICLKCLDKQPGRRYASARDLADDLRRFLNGEPIRARPSGPGERLLKWTRRRPALAALAGVSGAGLLLFLAGAVAYHVRVVGLLDEARREWERAEAHAEEARAHAEEARQQREAAAEQRQRAEGRLRNARAAVDQMLTRVSEDKTRLGREPRMEALRARLLQDALRFSQKLLAEDSSDPDLRLETALAHGRLAKVQRLMGQLKAAEKNLAAEADMLRRLVDDFPDRPAYRLELARNLHNRGLILEAGGSLADAEAVQREVLTRLEPLAAADPTNPDYLYGMARAHNALSDLLWLTDRLPAAQGESERAVALYRGLVARAPDNVLYRDGLAVSLHSLGLLRQQTLHFEEAEEAYREAARLFGELRQADPTDPEYPCALATTQENLAVVLTRRNQLHAAEEALRAAVEALEKLAKDFPHTPHYRGNLASALSRLGRVREQVGRPQEARQTYQRALALAEQLAADFPERADFQSTLGTILDRQAALARGAGNLAEARRLLTRAGRHHQAALRPNPNHRNYRVRLDDHFRERAAIAMLEGHREEAILHAEQLVRLFPNEGHPYEFLARILAVAVMTTEQDAKLSAEQRRELAERYAARSVRMLRETVQRFPVQPQVWLSDPALVPLRDRDDFRQLIREMEQRAPAPDGAAGP